MKKNQYYYAVTRIHSNEAGLLTDQAVERMRHAAGFSDCLNVLKEHGWTVDESMRVQEIISAQREKTWSFLEELAGSSDILNMFRYEHDFNNIKALIKLRYTKRMDEFGERYISRFGTLPPQTLRELDASGGFERLPELFSVPAAEANSLLLQTGSAQLADVILDNACLEAMRTEAVRQGGVVLKRYAETKADIANVKVAVRGLKMDKAADFFALAMTELGSLSKQELRAAVAKGIDAVYAYLGTTAYADCLDALKRSLSSFQAEAESRLIEEIKPQRHAIGGIDPIFAFIIAKENELSVVTLLLSSKINSFPNEFVSGCLRRMYA